jgi:hypothetical protein
MPLQLPVLDDRDFEQLLLEAKRRIPVHTPEWTNFDVKSDPGITIVELFAFLTESLLYRADRIPERNRLKFLQLLGIPLQPAAAARGIIRITNERGPVEPLPLAEGVVVTAGPVQFLTLDPVNVLPVEAIPFYKRRIPRQDQRYEEFNVKYQAIKRAAEAALELSGEAAEAAGGAGGAGGAAGGAAPPVQLDFYEAAQMTPPTPSAPNPSLNLSSDETTDQAIYLALLAPKNVSPAVAREALANQTLSIGVVPALDDKVPPLLPERLGAPRQPVPDFIYEVPDTSVVGAVRYERLQVRRQPDVLNSVGVVMVTLPGAARLKTWDFTEPLQEGTGDYPPRVEEDEIRARIVTWLRMRLPPSRTDSAARTVTAGASATRRLAVSTAGNEAGTLNARLTWVGINAARVTQAIPVVNEQLGTADGEPDQSYVLANTPVIEDSVLVEVLDEQKNWRLWRRTDDLLSADDTDEVFAVDYESGLVRFGDGLRGARPPADSRLRASYRFGGGTQGNVAIGSIKTSPDVRLQGGFKIENPVPTWGGDLGETVETGERRIPLHLRHRDRLVTARDFRDIAERTPGVDVGRVEVLPLYQPERRIEDAAGVVTLMVVPATDTVRPLWPSPNRLFLRAVCDHLDARRLVTTEVYARGPEYVPVALSVGVEIRAGHFRDRVIQTVRERLAAYLSALPPGGPDELGWPLNKRLLRKDFEAVVTRVPGVEFVNSLELGVAAELNVEGKDLRGLQLPRLDVLEVREGAAESLESILVARTEVPRDPVIVPVPVTKTKC